MNILLASESFVVKDSLENLLKELTYAPQILSISDLNKIHIDEIIEIDIIFTKIKENRKNQIELEKGLNNKHEAMLYLIQNPL